MNKNKLAIFDMDGTLFDTKNVNYQAYSKALKLCGFEECIDYECYCDFCNGNNYKVFLPQIIENLSEEKMKEIHDKKKELYADSLVYARKNIHLFNIIELIKKEYVIALVTTASLKNVTDILEKFMVTEKFDLIVTQEDVRKTKPDPECFHLAMLKAGIDKENTIIFEDSETGLEAAKASGAQYVQVYGYN